MKTINLTPEAWEIIRKHPKIQLFQEQSTYLKEAYKLPKGTYSKFKRNNHYTIY